MSIETSNQRRGALSDWALIGPDCLQQDVEDCFSGEKRADDDVALVVKDAATAVAYASIPTDGDTSSGEDFRRFRDEFLGGDFRHPFDDEAG